MVRILRVIDLDLRGTGGELLHILHYAQEVFNLKNTRLSQDVSMEMGYCRITDTWIPAPR